MSSVVNRMSSALSRVLERPVEPIEETNPRSARATVIVGSAVHELELRWVGRGWPADLEQALDALPDRWPRQLVLVGQRFSPGAVDQLLQRRANWLDETGAARIETDTGLLVVREPDDPATLNSLAWLRATCPADAIRDGVLAVADATRACELTGHAVAGYLDTLAAAHAEAGQFGAAVRWQEKVVAMTPPDQRDEYERRLALYRNDKPFRDTTSSNTSP